MANSRETVEVEKNVLFGGGSDIKSFCNVRSLGSLLIDLLDGYGDKVALIDAITDDHLTYRQILNGSIETAKCFTAAGLKLGDTIGIVCENRLEYSIPLLAGLFLGLTIAPINPTYTERELLHAFGLSQPKWIFTSQSASHNVARAAAQTKCIQKIIQLENKLLDGNTILFRDFIAQYKESHLTGFSPAIVNFEHNALILCSSGTTGIPKGVQLTYMNMLTSLDLFKDLITDRVQMEKELCTLGIIPFFHTFGCLVLLGVCAYGGKTVVIQKFEESLFLSCIQKHRITVLFTVPPMLIFLAKSPLVDKYDLSSIKEICCGAAPLSGETASAVAKRLNNKVIIVQGFGMTETTCANVSQNPNGVLKPGSVGTLSRATYCKVIDPDTGKLLGKNQAGELCFKGPVVMKGYIRNDDATRNTIDPDGWLHTGDVGYYDDDYHFYIVDRLKELIKYKGYQVPPAEIEAVLLTNPKVKDAAVIGLPDELSGELPLAFVVVQPNAKLTEEEVIKYVEDRVSSTKRLRGGIRFINEIPKTASGKILRKDLRALPTKSKM